MLSPGSLANSACTATGAVKYVNGLKPISSFDSIFHPTIAGSAFMASVAQDPGGRGCPDNLEVDVMHGGQYQWLELTPHGLRPGDVIAYDVYLDGRHIATGSVISGTKRASIGLNSGYEGRVHLRCVVNGVDLGRGVNAVV